jgi:hypothetical protein
MRAASTVLALLAIAGAAQAAPQLTVSPSTISGDAGWVRVTWSGWTDESTKPDCFVAQYAIPNPNTTAIPTQAYPATAPWTANAPAQFVTCTTNSSFAATGVCGTVVSP